MSLAATSNPLYSFKFWIFVLCSVGVLVLLRAPHDGVLQSTQTWPLDVSVDVQSSEKASKHSVVLVSVLHKAGTHEVCVLCYWHSVLHTTHAAVGSNHFYAVSICSERVRLSVVSATDYAHRKDENANRVVAAASRVVNSGRVALIMCRQSKLALFAAALRKEGLSVGIVYTVREPRAAIASGIDYHVGECQEEAHLKFAPIADSLPSTLEEALAVGRDKTKEVTTYLSTGNRSLQLVLSPAHMLCMCCARHLYAEDFRSWGASTRVCGIFRLSHQGHLPFIDSVKYYTLHSRFSTFHPVVLYVAETLFSDDDRLPARYEDVNVGVNGDANAANQFADSFAAFVGVNTNASRLEHVRDAFAQSRPKPHAQAKKPHGHIVDGRVGSVRWHKLALQLGRDGVREWFDDIRLWKLDVDVMKRYKYGPLDADAVNFTT